MVRQLIEAVLLKHQAKRWASQVDRPSSLATRRSRPPEETGTAAQRPVRSPMAHLAP